MEPRSISRDNIQRRSAVMPGKQLSSTHSNSPTYNAPSSTSRRQIVSMDSGIDVLVLNFYYEQLFKAKESADKKLKDYLSRIKDRKTKIFIPSTAEALNQLATYAEQLLIASADSLVGGLCQEIIGNIFGLKKERVVVSKAASIKVRSRTVAGITRKDTEKDKWISELLIITSEFSLIVSSLDAHDRSAEDFREWTSKKFEKEGGKSKQTGPAGASGLRVSIVGEDTIEVCRICENQLARSLLNQHTYACVELQGIDTKIDYTNTNLEKAYHSLETELQTSSQVAIKEPKNEIEDFKNNFLQSVTWLTNTLTDPIRKLQLIFNQLSKAYSLPPVDFSSLTASNPLSPRSKTSSKSTDTEAVDSGLKELYSKIKMLEMTSFEICFAVTSKTISTSVNNGNEDDFSSKAWKIENTSKHGDIRDQFEGSLSKFFEDTYSSITKMERVLIQLNEFCSQIIQFEIQVIRNKLSLRDILATIIKKFNRLVEKYSELSKFLVLKKQIPEEMMDKKVDVSLRRRIPSSVIEGTSGSGSGGVGTKSLKLPSPRASEGSRSPRSSTRSTSPSKEGASSGSSASSSSSSSASGNIGSGKLTIENWLRATKRIIEKISNLPTSQKNSLTDCEKYITQLQQLINLKDKILTQSSETGGRGSNSDLTSTTAVLTNILKLMKDKEQLLKEIHENQRLENQLGLSISKYYENMRGGNSKGGKKSSKHSISDFDIVKPISRGAYGAVFLAQKKTTGDIYAIKTLKKQETILKNQAKFVDNERNILTLTDNPFVVKLFYTFQSQYHLYMVMEYLPGGDLFSLLKNLGSFEEEAARVYTAEIILALEYLHNNKIVHRDLKPDNILITRNGHIKLTDFGLSAIGLLEKQDRLRSSSINPKRASVRTEQTESVADNAQVGTPEYMAPEILLGLGGGEMVDVWALGCILYEFLVGLTPFYGDSIEEVFENILSGNIMWPEEEEFSNDAQDAICKLLICSPADRITIKALKKHPWFKPINWDTVLSSTPPFVPQFDDSNDTSYFEARNDVFKFDDKLLNDILQKDSESSQIPGSFGEPNSNAPPPIFRKFSYTSLNHLASVNQSIASRGTRPKN